MGWRPAAPTFATCGMLDQVALIIALLALAVAVWNTHATRRNSQLTIDNTLATEANTVALAENTAAAVAAHTAPPAEVDILERDPGKSP